MLDSYERLCEERPSLYPVHVHEWAGCVFVNLADGAPRDFDGIMDPHIDTLKNWPLADLQLGHTHQATLHCNWKVFWENFLECYHCPGIHPELCEMVPVYRTGVSTAGEAHTVPAFSGSRDPAAADGVRTGAETWSMDGCIHGARFSGLSAEEIAVGYVFVMAWPTMYIVAHPDYVRLVSFLPLGPEHVQLTAEWLFPAETLRMPDFDLRNVTAFATMVMEQDGRASELNQSGLRSLQHRRGMLVPQEQDIARFHHWVREQTADA
jgi:Rieske 2Fe-2S family protein